MARLAALAVPLLVLPLLVAGLSPGDPADADASIQVIVQFEGDAVPPAVDRVGEALYRYQVIDAVLARIPAGRTAALEAAPEVERVDRVEPVPATLAGTAILGVVGLHRRRG